MFKSIAAFSILTLLLVTSKSIAQSYPVGGSDPRIEQFVGEVLETKACESRRVYIQCYGFKDCEEASQLKMTAITPFVRAGLVIERPKFIWRDEEFAASSKGWGTSFDPSRPTPPRIVHHTDKDRECANALSLAISLAERVLQTHRRKQAVLPVYPLSPKYEGEPGTIEIWWSSLP